MNKYENLLNELYDYTVKESISKLTKKETKRYIEIVNTLHKNNIEIPFGIEI